MRHETNIFIRFFFEGGELGIGGNLSGIFQNKSDVKPGANPVYRRDSNGKLVLITSGQKGNLDINVRELS